MQPNGDKRWERRKDQILFTVGVCGIIFETVVAPILKYEFRIEYLLLFAGMLGIPLARFGDRK
jgi:hypothetical protein